MKMRKKIIRKRAKFKLKYRKKSNKKFQSKNIRKFSLIIFLILLYTCLILSDKFKIPLEQYQALVFPEIVAFEKNLNLTIKMFDEFRKINSENKLIEEKPKFKRSINPDITVILTMYNQAHCIHKGLRSVQNQSLKNIEIIIVDDCSLDNSTEVIKVYQKEDPRIILISHDTNKGAISSRIDGIRKAKGKYITIIDGDDALIHKDILKNSLFIIQKAKLDVVEFKARHYYRGRCIRIIYEYKNINISYIIHQPELRMKFVEKKSNHYYYLHNRAIWGKLIKAETFKKLLIFIGSEFVDDYINEAEDTLEVVGLFLFAKSYYVMKEIGFYYSNDEKNGRYPHLDNKKCKVSDKIKEFGWYKFYKFLVDKCNQTEKEKLFVLSEMKHTEQNKYFKKNLNHKHYEIMLYVYNKTLEWDCLSNQQRQFITNLKNKAIEKMKRDNIN